MQSLLPFFPICPSPIFPGSLHSVIDLSAHFLGMASEITGYQSNRKNFQKWMQLDFLWLAVLKQSSHTNCMASKARLRTKQEKKTGVWEENSLFRLISFPWAAVPLSMGKLFYYSLTIFLNNLKTRFHELQSVWFGRLHIHCIISSE